MPSSTQTEGNDNMRFLYVREALLCCALTLTVAATAQVASLSDQLRIDALQRTTIQVDDHEKRIIHLEDAVAEINATGDEVKWWLRGIGVALGLAIAERVLRTAGVLAKTDGAGPVG